MENRYRIKCYVPVDVEPAHEIWFDTYEEAVQELDELESLQPENRYEIETTKGA